MANWVRFADTKATILTAGLGVVVTMLMANASKVATAISSGCHGAYVVGGLAGSSLIVAAYTLYWLVRAVGPSGRRDYPMLNRFAWPSLVGTTPGALAHHVATGDVAVDAWQQVIDLSVLADRKFAACGKAVRGFAVLVVVAVACVSTAIAFTA